jgi:hypothetical protein
METIIKQTSPNPETKLDIGQLKRKRSSVLHQMQIMGIDTSDWKRVNELCLNKRIAGKLFHKLSGDELDAVLLKLRIIKRKKEPRGRTLYEQSAEAKKQAEAVLELVKAREAQTETVPVRIGKGTVILKKVK